MGLFLVLAFSLAGSGGVPQSMGVNNSFGEIKIKRMVAPDFSLDLYDDREISIGNKISANDLIGVPYQILIGKNSEGNLLEFKEIGKETQQLSLNQITDLLIKQKNKI